MNYNDRIKKNLDRQTNLEIFKFAARVLAVTIVSANMDKLPEEYFYGNAVFISMVFNYLVATLILIKETNHLLRINQLIFNATQNDLDESTPLENIRLVVRHYDSEFNTNLSQKLFNFRKGEQCLDLQ